MGKGGGILQAEFVGGIGKGIWIFVTNSDELLALSHQDFAMDATAAAHTEKTVTENWVIHIISGSGPAAFFSCDLNSRRSVLAGVIASKLVFMAAFSVGHKHASRLTGK